MYQEKIDRAKRFTALSPEDKMTFIQKLTEQGGDFTALPILPNDTISQYPLSYAQQSLWLTWQLEPKSAAYNMTGVLHIKGFLDRDVLKQALLALVKRHCVLRTTFFVDENGRPMQLIQPLSESITIEQADISHLSAEKSSAAGEAHISEFTLKPFDLCRGSALRVKLIRLANENHQLLLGIHHINGDGWSVSLLIRDLIEFYQAAVEGRAPMLPTLPISFADFALWQRTWLDAGEKQRQLEYWKQQLGSENSVLTLPTRKPRSTVSGNQQANHLFSFDKTLSDKLRICAKRNNASVFIVLQAVFSLVLFRYSGMKNIRMGMPVVNRRRAETHNLVGYLTNVQVLSTLIDPRQTFEQLLAQVRDNVLDGQAYQDVPFDMLVEALQPQRQAGVNPLFQVKITEQAAISKVYKFAGLTMTLKGSETSLAHFDLSFDFTDRGDSITGCMAYIAELYDSTLIERLCTSFTCYLRQLLDAADTPLGSTLHDLQSSVVIRKQTFEQGDTFLNIWSHVLSSNEQQCAVVQGTFNLTYGELDTYAGKLAEKLKNSGVTRGVPVGVYANRSPEFVIAMLAVLKAGGAYVPLDPQLPDDRLQWQLQDSGAQLLLAAQPPAWIVAIPQRDISLESLTQASIGDDEVFIEPLIHPEQAAYIIYTSGSTGRPKGVVISHHSLSNYIQALLAELNLSKAVHSMAMVSTVAADLGHSMLFGALSCGKTLHLINHDTAMDPAAFADYMQSHQIDVLKLVPSHMRALLQAGQAEQVLPRHTLIMGGEALTWSLLQEIQTAHPQCRVINHYGPTEATVGVLTQNTARADSSALTVPVGSPLANVSACIMDISFSPVPIGVSGELYLGGAGIARGYLSQPVLTAERFVPDPFISGARLYRTGDKARQRDDGSIEFLGRVDDQVKIRGYRVELSEITTHIMAQEGVQQAEVIAHQTEDERTVLYGYVVAKKEHTLDIDKLQVSLSKKLPDYMVPCVLTVLETIPLTVNGKVDRKALPLLNQQEFTRYEAPEGEIEEVLEKIWADVLRVEKVSRHDDFFKLGGDSILSLQIVARSRKAGWKITPKQLFDSQSIAVLATVVSPMKSVEFQSSIPDMQQKNIPLLPIQSRFFQMEIPERHHWNQSILLQSDKAINSEALNTALQVLIQHHDALHLCYHQEEKEQWIQTYSKQVDEHRLWLRSADSEEAITVLCNEAQSSLDLQSGNLLRAVLIKVTSEGEIPGWRLCIVIHHLVIDGVSWRVLLEDLQVAYQQEIEGEKACLPPKTDSFQSWSNSLQEYSQTTSIRDEKGYWSQTIDFPNSIICDYPAGMATQETLVTQSFKLNTTQTEKLLKHAGLAYRTQINDLLLTALARALCAWSDQQGVLIDLEGHGRESLSSAIDLSRTIGWCTSLFPVGLSPQGKIGEAIKTVKEQLREVPNKGLHYGLLKYMGHPDDRIALSSLPQPEVVFNYLGQFDNSFDDGSIWQIAKESAGASRSRSAPLQHALAINGQIYQDELCFELGYSSERHTDVSIEQLKNTFARELHAIIEHCCSKNNKIKGVTPSDFPLAKLEQQQLDQLPVALEQLENLYLLSPMQQGMLFHTLYDPEGLTYINQTRVTIEGLDVDRFRQAWQAVLDRHDILRTGFITVGSEQQQWVSKRVVIPFTLHAIASSQPTLDELAQSELTTGFVLETPPLLKLALVEIDSKRYHLILTMHHLITDGWSTSLMMAEVLHYYQGESLPPVRGQYCDYIAWLQNRDKQGSHQYWQRELSTLDTPTFLANALPAPLPGQTKLGRFTLTVTPEKTTQLVGYARQQQVTVNTLIQAAWLLLLQRYSGQSTVCFGATVAGRPAELAEAEKALGLFINTLPVINQPGGSGQMGPWLRELQSQNLTLREHEHVSLADIQRCSGQDSRGLFDTLLVFENYPVDQVLTQELPGGLAVSDIANREESNYPLVLIIQQADTVTCDFTYARDSFSDTHIRRIGRHLEQLLGAIQHADHRLADINLLSAEEIQQLTIWSHNPQPYPAVVPVQVLIEQHAEKNPETIALVFEEQKLNYHDLNNFSNCLAHYLIDQGVGPDVPVGIAVERSIEMVIGLLAILKAGGAYVPLDPEYPEERLAYMIEQSGIEIILTQSNLVKGLPLTNSHQVVALDKFDFNKHSVHNPDIKLHADNLAYVIFTSGSTGKPKGVANRHCSLYNRLTWMQKEYQLTADDRVLQKTPFSFDVSVWEFFWPLMTGARLVIAKPNAHRDPERLVEIICQQKITTVHFVPSMLTTFMGYEGASSCHPLRQIICSGEALALETQQQVSEHLPKSRLHNLYGPTEAAIDVTYWPCRTEIGVHSVPIGRPIDNISTLILDRELQLVPQGVAGELYLGGIGLASGYIHRLDLTAERFVPNPFTLHSEEGERLYRTGDLARWRDDGVIEYLGRIDQQVKIRGLRIELGEIEAHLKGQAAVTDAVIGVFADRLVAYWSGDADPGALMATLKSALPDYMMPSDWINLPSLPLSPNGKVDRKALPNPKISSSAGYVAPQGEIEEALAAIWADVLKIDRVGREDNFFELGGHSLNLMQLKNKIHYRFGVEIPLKQIFLIPVLGQISDYLSSDYAQVQRKDTASDIEAMALLLDGLEEV